MTVLILSVQEHRLHDAHGQHDQGETFFSRVLQKTNPSGLCAGWTGHAGRAEGQDQRREGKIVVVNII